MAESPKSVNIEVTPTGFGVGLLTKVVEGPSLLGRLSSPQHGASERAASSSLTVTLLLPLLLVHPEALNRKLISLVL